jgi:hypothetical protein
LFWTVAIPPGSVAFNFDAATASLDVSHLKIDDYHDVVNALTTDIDLAHGTIDIDLDWSGALSRGSFTNTAHKFDIDFIRGAATLSWAAQEPGFEFVSTSTNPGGFAEIGKERNGVFFT